MLSTEGISLKFRSMFIHDKPIEAEKDDFLSRKGFSQHLAKSILNWKEKESLIIAIYGEWGSGKSSAINLADEYIQKVKEKDKPTIIFFNPWLFSEQDNLSEHFFNEIAKELEIKEDTDGDKKIAEKFLLYSSLLSLSPGKNLFNSSSSKIIL
ncbi:MAG: P-loop NTPase fold protein, partial [Euryarchaeota archaeon]|nr:P-loop NTPase fold protein [Euryarchaeota archaeon]